MGLTSVGSAVKSLNLTSAFRPEIWFLGLLILRPSLDGKGNLLIGGTLSLLALLGVVILLMFFILLLTRKYYIHIIDLTFMCWILVLLASTLFVSNNRNSYPTPMMFKEIMRILSIYSVFGIAKIISVKLNVIRFVYWLLLGLVIPIGFAAYQVVTSSGQLIANVHRIDATFSHPNSFARFLVVTLGLSLWALFRTRYWLWIFVCIIQIAGVILTANVSGIVMLTLLLVAACLQVGNLSLRLITVTLLVIGIVGFFFAPGGRQRFEEQMSLGDPQDVLERHDFYGRGTLAWRLVQWSELWQARRDGNAWFGLGLKSSEEVSPWAVEAHNDYLRFMLETGILGLIMFCLLLLAVARFLYNARKNANTDIALLSKMWFGVFFALVAASFAANVWDGTAYLYYFWAVLGVLVGRSTLLATIQLRDHVN